MKYLGYIIKEVKKIYPCDFIEGDISCTWVEIVGIKRSFYTVKDAKAYIRTLRRKK